MHRPLFAGIGIAVAALAACGKSPAQLGGGSGSGSNGPGTGVAVDPRSGTDLPASGNPTSRLVLDAFHGKKPAFPQLSKDGSTAIVELETRVGQSGATTYAIGYLVTANAVPSLVTLVDGKLVQLLVEAADDHGAPVIDTDGLSKIATDITTRLTADGFTAFEGRVELSARGDTAVGPGKLHITTAPDGGLTIELTGSTAAATTAAEPVLPVAMGTVSGTDCTSRPIARTAWFDSSRKRVLVQVGWNVGAESCEIPDDQYRLLIAP